jgi:hypothetical protein
MSQKTGYYYSLIQFCPDPSRLEGVNIGVGLYSPAEKRVLVQIARNNQRIRKFFGNQDWRLVSRAKSSIENQLKSQQFLTVEEFEAYISKRANLIKLTSPRPLRVADAQTDLKELFQRLVGVEATSKGRVNGFLTKKLKEAGVVSLVKKSVEIEIPEIKRSIRVPYGYQNGRFNLITPVQFDSDPEAIISKTGKSAIEGKLLYEMPHSALGRMRLVVVANFDEQIESSTRNFVQKTLDDHFVKLYSFDDLGPLMKDIRLSATAHGGRNAEAKS